MKKIKTAINEKWLDENGILRMKVIEGAFIDLPSLIEDAKVNTELTGGEKAIALYDARPYFTITSEASDYLKNGILNKTRLATAVLTDRLGVRIIVNFMNTVQKPRSPLKMFKDEEEAIDWLLSIKHKRLELANYKKRKH